MRRATFLLLTALALPACIKPQSNGARLIDAAHEVVTASRFGRMDVVLSKVRASEREKFAISHAEWGNRVRIMDIEYGGVMPVGDGRAMVMMNVAWTRLDETVVRMTTLRQTWVFGEETWEIIEEKISGGDRALLHVPDEDFVPPVDVAIR